MSILFNTAIGIAAYTLYKISGTLLRKYFIAKLTALNELNEIGTKSTRKPDKLRGSAVICGGSISGLLAARACSDHFQEVIIVESEEWITSPEGYSGSHRKELANKRRSHVSQYRASHSYQPFLIAALMKWFPDFKEECEKIGGRILPLELPITFSGLPFPEASYPKENQPMTLALNRADFEVLLRRLVLKTCKNVRYLAGTALGLEQSRDSTTITGVHVRICKGDEITLPAILAIDCTGSSSAGLRWLKDLATAEGNEKALQKLDNLRQTYNPKQSYRTCEFDVPESLVPHMMEIGYPVPWYSSGLAFATLPDPNLDNKLFAVARKDNNYLEILLGGWSVTDEISDIEDIRSYLASLKLYRPLPAWLLRMLDVLEENNVPFSIDDSRLGSVSYIPYNLYEHMPSNFIVMGDSAMRVNPIRAIGLTQACVEALTLNGLLNKCYSHLGVESDQLPKVFSKHFRKLQASRLGNNWDKYKADDYDRAVTIPAKGDDPKSFGRFYRAFGRLILQASLKPDNDFLVKMGYIRGLLAPPTDLFAPTILLKLLKVKLFDKSPLV